MIFLQPTKQDVLSVHVISTDYDERERRVFLGYFAPEISYDELAQALLESGAMDAFMTADAIAQGQADLLRRPTVITEGVIFETADECVNMLQQRQSYQDLVEASRWTSGISKNAQD